MEMGVKDEDAFEASEKENNNMLLNTCLFKTGNSVRRLLVPRSWKEQCLRLLGFINRENEMYRHRQDGRKYCGPCCWEQKMPSLSRLHSGHLEGDESQHQNAITILKPFTFSGGHFCRSV